MTLWRDKIREGERNQKQKKTCRKLMKENKLQ